MIAEKDEISGHTRLARVVTRPASDAVLFKNRTCGPPSDAVIFNLGVRGVLVCLFSRKPLKLLTLFHKNSFEIACAKPHIDSDTSLAIASAMTIEKAQKTNAGSAPSGTTRR